MRRLLLGLALAVAMPLAAQTASGVRHTAADVRFMQGMIHHHAQAVAMAALVPSRTARQDLTMLAQRIDVSQVDEMAMMRQWLRDRDEEVPAEASAHAAHGEHGAMTAPLMPGMLSAEEMAALERSTGDAFVRRFLEGMIKHHQGAITMVRALFATPGAAQETAIFSFAADVESDQQAEIDRMRKLLATLGR
jgi:uncharacterized protein (DUF305 family)